MKGIKGKTNTSFSWRYTSFALVLITLMWHPSIGQTVDTLEKQNGFDYHLSLRGDFAGNVIGGIKKSTTYMGIAELELSFDTEKAGWWKGGLFFVHGMNTHGGKATEEFVGDLQTFSNIEAGDYTGLFQYYFQQQLGRFSVLIGQHDLNADFVVCENGSNLINSSFGIYPSISLNMPVPIFPMASPGMFIKYESKSNWVLQAGIYDGDPGDFETNKYGINWKINRDEGGLAIGEIQYHLERDGQRIASYKAGYHYHTATYTDLSDTTRSVSGNDGFYIAIDQKIGRMSEQVRGTYLFGQGGYSPKNCSLIDYYAGVGIRFIGMVAKRERDELNIGIAHASVNDKICPSNQLSTVRSETAIETSFLYHVNDHIVLQPDIQYIIYSRAAPYNINNTLVGLIRFQINF